LFDTVHSPKGRYDLWVGFGMHATPGIFCGRLVRVVGMMKNVVRLPRSGRAYLWVK
jgi:hypothetical protein